MVNAFGIICLIAIGVINGYSIYKWHKAEQKAVRYDARGDIIAAALLRYMQAHGCPTPDDDKEGFSIHLDWAVNEWNRKQMERGGAK